MNIERFKRTINTLDKVRKGEVYLQGIPEEAVGAFIEEFDLLDPRKFSLTS